MRRGGTRTPCRARMRSRMHPSPGLRHHCPGRQQEAQREETLRTRTVHQGECGRLVDRLHRPGGDRFDQHTRRNDEGHGDVLRGDRHTHPISTFYVDGNRTPAIPSDRDANVVAVVKGDSKIPEIMAASILAKTARDRFMIEMDALYPQYGFAVHKGYGTRAHIQALEEFGPCPLHRRTFLRRILSREEPV